MTTAKETTSHLVPVESNISEWPLKFHVQLDLMPMITRWRKIMEDEEAMFSASRKEAFENTLKEFPLLTQPINDITVLEPHQDFMELLASVFLPVVDLNTVLMAITPPFSPYPPLYASQNFHHVLRSNRSVFGQELFTHPGERMDFRMLYGYKFILKKFYNYDLNVDQPVKLFKTDQATGLTQYFKLLGTGMYMDVVSLGPLPEVSPQQLQDLLKDHFDENKWSKVLPPENFMFRGATVLCLVDTTTEESIGRLQFHLLKNQNVDQQLWFEGLQKEVQNLFRLPGMRLGIATIQRNGELNFTSPNPLWNSLLLREVGNETQYQGSLYEDVIRNKRLIIYEDLRDEEHQHDPVIQAIVKAGFYNILLTPVYYNNDIIGVLELASTVPGLITGLSLFKINHLNPLFGIAQNRLLEEFENKVEAIMMQQFTSIHPSISWRFRDAAIQYLEKPTENFTGNQIIFENVMPFYGSLDIRDSSKKRNKAIELDLAQNLQQAHAVLKQGFEKISFDILGELMHEVAAHIENLECSFNTREESKIVNFIRQDLNPVILHLHQDYPDLRPLTEAYIENIGPEAGTFTSHRIGYEAALAKVNQTIVRQLELEELALQKLYPCYFEKYQTDGVEYNIYAGSSIARGRNMDPLYLDNLRLRQLIWTCQIIRDVNAMEPELHRLLYLHGEVSSNGASRDGYGIEIAPLIMAYGNPITIRFKQDEKKLDVDGSYNIRYEIMKKRIDKSVVQGTAERLTQPGHIAIVYSHEQEILLYQKHFVYLVKKGLIEDGRQDLMLEPLQGIDGLKAVRLKIKADS